MNRHYPSKATKSLKDGISQTPAYKKVKRKQTATPKRKTMSRY